MAQANEGNIGVAADVVNDYDAIRRVKERSHHMKHMKRIGSVLAVAAVMMGVTAAPSFADKGGVKPLTYGDCTSFYASNSESGLVPEPKVETVQEWTDLTAPTNSNGQGTADEVPAECAGFPPPPNPA